MFEGGSTLEEGLVLRIDAKAVQVAVAGREVAATLRGRLFEQLESHRKNPVAVGDRVRVLLDEGQASIEEVLPRRTALSRVSSGEEKKEQVLVANVDQLCLVASLRQPEPHPPLLDRILAAAHHNGLAPLVVLNKTDLDPGTGLEALRAIYAAAGYPVFPTCALEGTGLEPLKDILTGKITALAGPSGAGKSSLLNALQPGLGLRTGKVGRKGVHSGRHTTTFAQLLALDFGGFVVDTPGIRNFGLWGLSREELAHCFPEFAPYLDACAFADCSHTHEPDCGLRTALDQGRIPPSRYQSYIAVLAELPRWEEPATG